MVVVRLWDGSKIVEFFFLMVTRPVPELKLNQNQKISVCVRVWTPQTWIISEGRQCHISIPPGEKCGLDQLSEISPSCRDALELWPSVTSPDRDRGKGASVCLPCLCCRVSAEKHFFSSTTSACPLLKLGIFSACVVAFHKCHFSSGYRSRPPSGSFKRSCRGVMFRFGAWDKMPTLVAGPEN